MQWNFSYSVKKFMYLLKSLVSKNIERWDYKRYVLFVDSYSEKDFLKISTFFSLNVDNEGSFRAGFHKVIKQQWEIILRLIKLFSNLALIIFRQDVVNRMINLKNKILLCLLWDEVSPYLNLSSFAVGVVPFLRKIT